ncbi:MAG TPA: hypothetical protein VI197_11795 [Polyangiaceae bacterium]
MLRNKVGVLALAGAAASWSTSALADSVVVLDNYTVERSDERDSDEQPQTISFKDCEENADVLFPLNVSLTGGRRVLEVYVGPESCLDREVRNNDCRVIYGQEIGADNPSIRIPSQEIVGDGGEDCESSLSSGTNASASLLFAFEGSNGEPEADGSDVLQMSYDVTAPDPPQVTGLGQGDGQLVPRWEPLEGEDVTGYRFYCQESPTTQEEVDSGSFDAAGAGGQGGASSAGCETSIVPGRRPPEDARFCGEQAGKTAQRGTVTGVVNDRVYAVGVVAQDVVGNEGVVSNVLCQYPKEVTDFYEAYTAAGGKGGGGFCAFGYGQRANAWSGLVLLGLALGWARRRRRRA